MLAAFPAWFEQTTGAPFPLEILAGPDDESVSTLSGWLYARAEDRPWRARMARWPAATLVAGAFEPAMRPPRHPRVLLFGDAARARWREAASAVLSLPLPATLQRRMGPDAIERYVRPDGTRGLALHFAGAPAQPERLARALELARKAGL